MFAGNIDDCFRIGVAIKKNTINLYAKFYSADLIIASPLGLRMIIGAEGLVDMASLSLHFVMWGWWRLLEWPLCGGREGGGGGAHSIQGSQ
jgi:hypothetical protein